MGQIRVRVEMKIRCVGGSVPVSLVVHWHDVHGDVILLMRVQSCDLHSHGRKHPPDMREREKNNVTCLLSFFFTQNKSNLFNLKKNYQRLKDDRRNQAD